MARLLAHTGILVFSMVGATAFACGICIEDKVAAVYDYETVTQALAHKHRAAFFAIEGDLAVDDASRRTLIAMIASTRGVDKNSGRVSVESASLSFTFDPQRYPVEKLERALQQKLAARRLSLSPLKIMTGALSPSPAHTPERVIAEHGKDGPRPADASGS